MFGILCGLNAANVVSKVQRLQEARFSHVATEIGAARRANERHRAVRLDHEW
jgi:hypothetical protein